MRFALLIALTLIAPPTLAAAPCPSDGARVELALTLADGAAPSTALLFGTLAAAACDEAGGALTDGYAARLTCGAGALAGCRAQISGLRPGTWMHRVLVVEGEAAGQLQGRAGQLLDASAGTHRIEWPLYRSVHTVATLDDFPECTDCLRAAIGAADLDRKPALIQFAPELMGTIPLVAALPPFAAGEVTLDALDLDGRPHLRTLDAGGLSVAALRVTSPNNRIVGARLTNVGGDSDTLLLDGPDAHGNVIESVAVVGRAVEVCGTTTVGCVVEDTCRLPSLQFPRGECGDDGIAVRNFAGVAAPNVIRTSDVRGAFDKGVKVSDGGVAAVQHSLIEDNADGGLQATLGGSLIAVENVVRANRGTLSANGIAANGTAVGGTTPAGLVTRGNLSLDNALRGISVRALSLAVLRDDFTCGNGVGLGVADAAGQSPTARVEGFAALHNLDAGAAVNDGASVSFGTAAAPGRNAFTGNGGPRANLRNQTNRPLDAIGNSWQHCGDAVPCDVAAVLAEDVFASAPSAAVALAPAEPTRQRRPPVIDAIEPPFAAAGDLVRIYGSGFDAIGGAGDRCDSIADANTCRPVRGNCVMIDRQPAAVIAATPTMLVIRAPFTCVRPVAVAARTRWSRAFGRATFCTVPPTAP